MYYEINVAKKRPTIYGVDGGYSHFFATDPRSCTTREKTAEVVRVLKEKFPEPEYKIDVSLWEQIGKGVNVTKLLEDKE